MYKSHTVYRKLNDLELMRFNIVESMSNGTFYVLHADFLRLNDHSNDQFLANLMIERLLEFEPTSVQWAETLDAAVSAHEREFADND